MDGREQEFQVQVEQTNKRVVDKLLNDDQYSDCLIFIRTTLMKMKQSWKAGMFAR